MHALESGTQVPGADVSRKRTDHPSGLCRGGHAWGATGAGPPGFTSEQQNGAQHTVAQGWKDWRWRSKRLLPLVFEWQTRRRDVTSPRPLHPPGRGGGGLRRSWRFQLQCAHKPFGAYIGNLRQGIPHSDFQWAGRIYGEIIRPLKLAITVRWGEIAQPWPRNKKQCAQQCLGSQTV